MVNGVEVFNSRGLPEGKRLQRGPRQAVRPARHGRQRRAQAGGPGNLRDGVRAPHLRPGRPDYGTPRGAASSRRYWTSGGKSSPSIPTRIRARCPRCPRRLRKAVGGHEIVQVHPPPTRRCCQSQSPPEAGYDNRSVKSHTGNADGRAARRLSGSDSHAAGREAWTSS